MTAAFEHGCLHRSIGPIGKRRDLIHLQRIGMHDEYQFTMHAPEGEIGRPASPAIDQTAMLSDQTIGYVRNPMRTTGMVPHENISQTHVHGRSIVDLNPLSLAHDSAPHRCNPTIRWEAAWVRVSGIRRNR